MDEAAPAPIDRGDRRAGEGRAGQHHVQLPALQPGLRRSGSISINSRTLSVCAGGAACALDCSLKELSCRSRTRASRARAWFPRRNPAASTPTDLGRDLLCLRRRKIFARALFLGESRLLFRLARSSPAALLERSLNPPVNVTRRSPAASRVVNGSDRACPQAHRASTDQSRSVPRSRRARRRSWRCPDRCRLVLEQS